LKTLVEPATGGNPMTSDKYVRRSLQTLSDELADLAHPASPSTVANLLRGLNYNLHVNVKRFTGPPHPDRNRQFEYIAETIASFRREGWPIVSVDSKKKELIGNFKNAGSSWCRRGVEVNAHDFLSDAECRAVPYGLYDVVANRGHVVVGTSADTPAFAVDAIARWWGLIGSKRYPHAGALLVLADAGGSNGCRPRLWKYRLQQLADRYALVVNVCHYPTGASKWNPVEHRLFGPISINWAGIPLQSPEVMLSCLRGTTTETGLRVTAEWRERIYPTGVQVTGAEMDRVRLTRHDICPRWNYSIEPTDLWN
jgi:Rhodopirellula transposase DDE domain